MKQITKFLALLLCLLMLVGTFSACRHTHVFDEPMITKEATCTEEGSQISICSECSVAVTETIPALGHDEIAHEAKAPTFEGIGWEAYVTCSRCDYTTYAEKDLPATEGLEYFPLDDGTLGVKIGNAAYLSEIVIPATQEGKAVTTILQSAFERATNLKKLKIPNSVTSIGTAAFLDCTGLTSVTFGSGIETVGSSAFSGCSSLTTIILPDSLQSIGVFAFYNCSALSNITLPATSLTIGEKAFHGTAYYNDASNWESTPQSQKLYVGNHLIAELDILSDDGIGMWAGTDKDMGGKTFRLLGFNAASANEFEVDAEDTGTTLKAAVYARNEALKGRLNCDLKWDYIAGHAGYEPQYVNEAGLRAASGQVHIFTPYSQAGSWLMQNGTIQDLKKINNLDLTASWWNQTVLRECSVNDRLYFAAGDISWTLTGNTIGFCFNKDILSQKSQVLEQFGVSSMYELVQQGKWTIDSFITISRAVAAKNTYGFTSYIVPMDAFYKGVGLNWMEVNANGQQEISVDQGSGRVNTVLGKLSPFFRTDAVAVRLAYDQNLDYATNNRNKSNPSNPEWQKGQSLFVLNPMQSITDFKFTELGFDFGVLPMPLYDESQFNLNDPLGAMGYRTTPDFEYSIVCIPRQVKGETLAQVGAVLQVLASEGQARIAPSYYEEVMKKPIADSIDDYTMWNTIKNSAAMDGGRFFTALGGAENDGFSYISFRRSLQLSKNTINEQWDGRAQRARDLVANMNAEMEKIENRYSYHS